MTQPVVETSRFGFRRTLGRPLRVGGINYLNSQPLIECLGTLAGADVELRNLPPSELARQLRSRRLDVALVPIVEYFQAPCSGDYWIVPGVSIASYGRVESIRLYYRGQLGAARRVALDSSSMTSQMLTRLFFAARPSPRWRVRAESHSKRAVPPPVTPVYEEVPPEEILTLLKEGTRGRSMRLRRVEDSFDAVLLIGDAALSVEPQSDRVSSGGAASPTAGWQFVDLGLEWTRWLGLPFVYAVWVYHGTPIPGLVEFLQEARDSGFARIDSIVDRGPLPPRMSRADSLRYLSCVIRFGFGEAETEALETFVKKLGVHDILTPTTTELRLLPYDPE